MAYTGIYHSSITAPGQPCGLALKGKQLHIYFQNGQLFIWNLPDISNCHLQDGELQVYYQHYPQQLLECRGDIASHIYQAWLNRNIPEQNNSLKGKYTSIVLICVGFMALFLCAYDFLLPWVAEKSTSLVPVSTEIEMGDHLRSVLLQEVKVNDSATYYANKFVRSMQLDNTYPLQVEVVESPEINAFALPGGHMVIYTGLLEKMESYDELAALFGHEVTHVTHRHSLKSIARGMASAIVIGVIFGDAGGVNSSIMSQADRFKQLDYSRDLETEADDNSVNILAENKIDPHGTLKLLELLEREEIEMPSLMKYLSDHPETNKRIEHIKQNPQLNSPSVFQENKAQLFSKIKGQLDGK